MGYLDCKTIDTAIRRAKENLIQEAKENGIYENFGQKEVREISDKFIDLSDYTDVMNQNRNKVENFNNWCMTFNVNDLF